MARPRLDRPLILIQAALEEESAFWRSFVKVATKYGWRLFNIIRTKGILPKDLRFNGAVTRHFADSEVIEELRTQGCHCIRIGNYSHPRDSELPVLYPDRQAAGRMAAEHFAARGYKHVGQVAWMPLARPDGMLEAFIERASELGMETHVLERDWHEHVLVGTNELDKELEEWLPKIPKPIGMLGVHELVASTISVTAQKIGLLVPQQVGIIAMGESFHCELTPIPLSAIEDDTAAMGRKAAQLLKRMMDGESPPPRTAIPPKRIISRQSSDVLAVPDLTVAKALRYIWEYYHWPLTVEDIALEAQVSRSTLERLFQRHLGRGINAEVQRKRLERCCELLKTTSKSVAVIAKACGFQHRGYLHRLFLKQFGMPPGKYRRHCREIDDSDSDKQMSSDD